MSTDADIATIREALALAHPITAEEAEAALEGLADEFAPGPDRAQKIWEWWWGSPPRTGTEQEAIQAIIAKRTQGALPLDEWGPRCAGCGAEEYRIDGYCSLECRDYHNDDDIRVLAKWIERLRVEATFVGFFARLTADALTRMAAEERYEAALTQHGVPLNELCAALERTGK